MDKIIRDHLRTMQRERANNNRLIQTAPKGTALAELNTLAQAIRTARPLLSFEQAFGEAMAQRPDLYERYCEDTHQ
jgi:hypothetical protein